MTRPIQVSQLFSRHQLDLFVSVDKKLQIHQLLAGGICTFTEHYLVARTSTTEMPLSALSSPSKQPMPAPCPSMQALCSPTRQPLSHCSINISRQTPCATTAKWSSAALQPNSSSVACSGSSPAHMRQERVMRGPERTANLPARSLATPAVDYQPLQVAGSSISAPGQQILQNQQHLRPSAAPSISLHFRPASSSRSAAGLSPPLLSAYSSSCTAALSADFVLPINKESSPCGIQQFPPGVDRVAGPDHQDCSRAALQQQQQRRAAMSGRRVSSHYDLPLGSNWLADAPDHVPELGSGRLDLIMGPMFAGKTTKMLQRVQEASGVNQVAVAVKSSKDERYGCHWVVTHDGRCMRCYTAETLQQFKEVMGLHYYKLQVLAIDEAQFFPDLLEFCRTAVDIEGKHVIVAGLSGDFKRQKFGQLLELMPLADSIMQLRSKCAFCEQDALFSLRMDGSGPQALVGGDDTYKATCRKCYLEHHSRE